MHGGNNPFAASPLRLCLSTTYFDTQTFLRVSWDLRIIYKKRYPPPKAFGVWRRPQKKSQFPEGFNLTKPLGPSFTDHIQALQRELEKKESCGWQVRDLKVSPNDKEMSGDKREVSKCRSVFHSMVKCFLKNLGSFTVDLLGMTLKTATSCWSRYCNRQIFTNWIIKLGTAIKLFDKRRLNHTLGRRTTTTVIKKYNFIACTFPAITTWLNSNPAAFFVEATSDFRSHTVFSKVVFGICISFVTC